VYVLSIQVAIDAGTSLRESEAIVAGEANLSFAVE